MENVTETIKEYLEANGYKITGVNDNGVIAVKYQMNHILICPNNKDKEFVSMLLIGVDKVDEENPLPMVLSCMQIVSDLMVIKAYPMNKENVAISYEFFFKEEEDLKFQIEKGFDSLMTAKVRYRRFKEENDN